MLLLLSTGWDKLNIFFSGTKRGWNLILWLAGSQKQKHQKYNKEFGRNVRFVIADIKGNILNDDDFITRLTRYYKQHLKKT